MAAIASPSRPPVIPGSMSAVRTSGNPGSNAMMIALMATIVAPATMIARFERTVSSPISRRTSARKHLKPPVRSRRRSPRTVAAYSEPPSETVRRTVPQSVTPPPVT